MNWPIGWTSLEGLGRHEIKYWQTASTASGDGGLVREMWFNREAGAPPHRQEPGEQRARERDGFVFSLPPQGTLADTYGEMCDLRNRVQAEKETQGDAMRKFELQQGTRKAISRIEVGIMARVDRLKCLGNGQVPACAAEAFRRLCGRVISWPGGPSFITQTGVR